MLPHPFDFNRSVILPEQNTIEQSQSWVVRNLLVWWQSPSQQQSGLTGAPVLQIVDNVYTPFHACVAFLSKQ